MIKAWWCSDENVRLPAMCPSGSISGPSIVLDALLVPIFLSSKTNISKFQFDMELECQRFVSCKAVKPEDQRARLYVLYTPSKGKRRPGRQKTSCLQYVQQLIGDDYSQLSPDQIANLARDKNSWRKFSAACVAANRCCCCCCCCWWWWK